MKIHTPCGAVGEEPGRRAPSLPVLSGRRIGVLDNTKPNAGVLLERLAERLAERTGASVALVETKNAALAAPDEVIARLTEAADVVITGSAD